MFLGLLGPDDVQGQRPTQEGTEIKVTGKGGDIKVNDTAKVVCGGIQANNARIYIIDTVLDPVGRRSRDHPASVRAHDHAPRRPPRTTPTAPAAPRTSRRPRLASHLPRDFGAVRSAAERKRAQVVGGYRPRSRPMISFMISVVPPKIVWMRMST